jgi:hypothetical protein
MRRGLHVDAYEETVSLGRLQNSPDVVQAGGAVDVETQLREFDREIALDA